MIQATIFSDFWNDQILAEEKQGLFLVLAGFILSFAFIRMSTRLMRSPKVPWWPGSVVSESGVHLHHLVFGIVTMMISGAVGFTVLGDGPWAVGELFTMADCAAAPSLFYADWVEEIGAGRPKLSAGVNWPITPGKTSPVTPPIPEATLIHCRRPIFKRLPANRPHPRRAVPKRNHHRRNAG